jgi:hypothetical protein
MAQLELQEARLGMASLPEVWASRGDWFEPALFSAQALRTASSGTSRHQNKLD